MKKSLWIFGGVALLLALVSWPRTSRLTRPSALASGTARSVSNRAQPVAAPLLAVKAAEAGTLTRPTQPAPASASQTSALASKPASEVVFAAFGQWANSFLSAAGDRSAMIEEGQRLAIERREALAQEIRVNPRGALEHAAPWKWRQGLPAEVAAYLEEIVVGRGQLEVYCAEPLPGSDYREFAGGMMRYVTMADSGRTYATYVYGRRVGQMGQENIAVYGIAVRNQLALHENPVRELDAAEAAAFGLGNAASGTSTCAICGVAVSDAGVVLDHAGQKLQVCGTQHAGELTAALVSAENASRRVGLASAGSTPSGGNSAWTNPPPADLAATYGTRRVLFMRVIFPDDTRVPITESEAQSVMDQVNDFYVEASYNKANLVTTVTPALMMPQPKLFYGGAGPGRLMSDAVKTAKAAGYDSSNYDFTVARHETVPSFTWGGLGGGNGKSGSAWLQGTGVGLIAHELGHVFGLPHANYWNTRRPALPGDPQVFDSDSLVGHDSVYGVGDNVEYGDIFDVMGSGGGEGPANTNQQVSSFTGHFNPVGKYNLGWLTDAYITSGQSGSTNRIYVYDTPRLLEGRRYALKVEKDAQRTYWISARGKLTDHWSTNSVEVHWGQWQQSLGYSLLLDTTPGSPYGRQDSGIVLGRTFGDEESKVYITPIARSGTGTNIYFDVVVFKGVATNNVAPEVELSASTNAVAVGAQVTFTATAFDANSDALSYYWDFSDAQFAPNSSTVTRTFSQAGEYVVRVEVSDMRGGKTTKHLVITVGSPGSMRISGFVVDSLGNPVRDARVSNGSYGQLSDDPVDGYGDDYQATYTDSDGAFTLVNLTNRSYAVGAFLEGYVTTPLNFDREITLVDKNAEGIRFQAVPRTVVTAKKLSDAVVSSATPGVFELTRTGDTNTALQAYFLLGGSARAGKDYKDWTNSVSQTNTTPNPFGPVDSVYKFYAIDFPTGVVSVQIPIVPNAGTNTADQTVALTLTYPLEWMQVIVTNGDTEGTLTNMTNFILYSDWELKNVHEVSTWFQNYAEYLPAHPGEARMSLKATPPSLPIISVLASVPNTTENMNDAGMFTLTRTGPTGNPTTVLLTYTGSAVAASDYDPLPTSVIFPAGVASINLPLVAFEDLYLEGNETVTVTVNPDSAYTVGSGTASVGIMDNDMPRVTIASTDSVASESGGDVGAFVVSRAGDMTRSLTVYYQAMGTAVSGRDYRTLPGSITIPAGQPSATIVVTPRDNNLKDGGNTLELKLSDNPNYNIGTPGMADLMILDRSVPTVTVAATVSAAAEPSTAGEFTFTRTGDTTKDLVVRFKMAGNAREFADYSPMGTSVRILAGQSRATLSLIPVNDTLREEDEYAILELVPDAAYNLGTAFQAMVTIADDDSGALPAVGFNLLSSSGPEAIGTNEIAVTVSAIPRDDQPVTVLYKITGGTAIPGYDYALTNATGMVTFAAGETIDRIKLIKIPLADNTNVESDRTIVVTLFEPPSYTTNWLATNDVTITNADGTTSQTNQVVTNYMIVGVPMNAQFDLFNSHTYTILDDDSGVISVEALDPVAREQGLKAGIFRIHRDGRTNKAQTVLVQLGGSASNGSDYQPVPSTLTIPAGEYYLDVPIIPVDDPIQEYMESVSIRLLSASGCKIGTNNTATINIIDNDGTVEFTQTGYRSAESVPLVKVPVRRTGYTNDAITVDFSVQAGTAVAGTDFLATNGTVTFAPGETLQYIPVTVIDNEAVQTDRTIQLVLKNVTGGAPIGGQNFATLTIVDDDAALEFTQASYRVTENGTNAVIALHRLGVLDKPLKANFTATNGTAVADVDFVGTNRTVILPAGVTNATVSVRILDNALIESNKTVMLMLSTNETSLGSVGPLAAATLEIAEDDCSLEFAATEYGVDEFARVVTLNVRRNGGAVNPVSVDYATADGTAKATVDYVGTRGTLAFAGETNIYAQGGSGQFTLQPGETNRSFQIRIIDNNTGEGNRTFTAMLGNPKTLVKAATGSAALGTTTNVIVTIVDDELPGSVDFGFNPGQGVDGPVYSVAVQPDGKVMFAGEFATVDGVAVTRVGRLHEDGYLDSFFNAGTGPNARVHVVTIQPDGRSLLGGEFTTINGVKAVRLSRLNEDGTIDDGFSVGAGVDGVVRAIAVGASGTIVIGGDFTTVDGESRVGVARLLHDGAVDASFDPAGGAAGGVYAVAVQADGRVIIGGAFGGVGDTSYSYVARLNANGSVDKTFNTGKGPDGVVRAIALTSDGKIVIGGAFEKVNGTARSRIARLNADGSLDTGFDPGSGANDDVYALAVQPDNKVVMAGSFTNVAGLSRNRYVRLNPNGVVDDGYLVFQGADGLVRGIAVQPDTATIIGGDFTTANGLDRRGIARIHGDEKFVLNKIQFASSAYRVLESAGAATITVLRSGDVTGAAQVNFATTTGGTAVAGVNYQPTNGTLTFLAGETEKTFQVAVMDDHAAAGNLTVNLALSNLPSGYVTAAQLTAVLTIEDKESVLAFSAPTYSVVRTETEASITVVRTGPPTNSVTVDYATADGTAVAGVDYTPVAGTLVFGAGVTERKFTVPILTNAVANEARTVALSLANITGSAVLGGQSNAVLSIVNEIVQFYSLNLTPPVGGSVDPGSGQYPAGSTQTLTATPDQDFQFVGWEGSTNTSVNPLVLVMNQNYSLNALFAPTKITYGFEPPFRASDLQSPPWINSATAPWQLASGVGSSGQHALKSGPIGNSQESVLEAVFDTRAGAISFMVHVSSEANWDFLEFYLNGVRLQRWSGEVPWQRYQFNVGAGLNRLTWRYVKDANFSAGQDAAFVDDLYVPLNVVDPTPVAAVLSVAGVSDGVVNIRLDGRRGTTYVLQASPDFGTWTPIGTNTLQGTSTLFHDPINPGTPQRFYRAVAP